jgi:succinate dehydrogenase / fumarate reductase cytochrome b subunit
MSAAAPRVIAPPAATTSRLERVLWSSIGLKAVMAVTGVILSGFVLAHMGGNLTAFVGAEALNGYAASLRKVPALLWGFRVTLMVSVVLHIWAYLMLTRTSWAARPQGYRKTAYQESTYASRTMRWTGPLLAAFVVYHLLHLTLGTVHPDFREIEVVQRAFIGPVTEAQTYHNLITGLRVAPVAVFYILAIGALALHLHHGVWSMFQTLGSSQPRYESFGRKFATAFTIVVCAGFAAVPIAVLAGILK